jgi:hypothetical protein
MCQLLERIKWVKPAFAHGELPGSGLAFLIIDPARSLFDHNLAPEGNAFLTQPTAL